jgi:hypothetical protein
VRLYSYTDQPSLCVSGREAEFHYFSQQSDCRWIADSDSPWLTVTSGTSGTGNGTINYSVAPNQTTNRDRHYQCRRAIFTVTQAGIIGTIFTVTNANDSGARQFAERHAQTIATTESRTIVFDQAVFNTPQTITLASNLLINSSNGGTITIYGPGANLLTITGSGATRIFTISSNTVSASAG